jgi:meso-butanediol dehydrogenase / (S,S)-butanediol dehydrogenase / diacetyl reductase
MSQRRLGDRVAVVVGASRGIGRSIAEEYAREGARVVCAARDEQALANVVEEIGSQGGEAVAVPCDATTDDGVAGLRRRTEEAYGPATVLVNSAGLHKARRFLDYELGDFRQLMEVNFFAVVRTMQTFLPGMIEAGYGKVVNVASTAGKYGSMFQSPYNSSKHAVVGLTRCVALETAKQGITVNAICPGFVDTEMVDRAVDELKGVLGSDDDHQVRSALLARVPMGRMLEPVEIAHLAVYLGSEESDGMTGQALTISGGLILV